MKYIVATIVLGVLGLCALGASEFDAQRAGQRAALIKGTVSAMSQQQLLIARRDCEPLDKHAIVTGAYCAEVQRIIESQSLQIVIRPRHFVFYKPS